MQLNHGFLDQRGSKGTSKARSEGRGRIKRCPTSIQSIMAHHFLDFFELFGVGVKRDKLVAAVLQLDRRPVGRAPVRHPLKQDNHYASQNAKTALLFCFRALFLRAYRQSEKEKFSIFYSMYTD